MQENDENMAHNEQIMNFSYWFDAAIFVMVIVGLAVVVFA